MITAMKNVADMVKALEEVQELSVLLHLFEVCLKGSRIGGGGVMWAPAAGPPNVSCIELGRSPRYITGGILLFCPRASAGNEMGHLLLQPKQIGIISGNHLFYFPGNTSSH